MKTKDFIKMLQEEDPSGELHVRMIEGGIPWFAESKPGYWDGPYSYIDDNGNYVISTENDKIDIHCFDIWDFVERNMNRDPNYKWEDIEKKFLFKLSYPEQNNQYRKESVLSEAKEAFDSTCESLKILKKLKNKQ